MFNEFSIYHGSDEFGAYYLDYFMEYCFQTLWILDIICLYSISLGDTFYSLTLYPGAIFIYWGIDVNQLLKTIPLYHSKLQNIYVEIHEKGERK